MPMPRPRPNAHPLEVIAWVRENNPTLEAYLHDQEIGLLVYAYVTQDWTPEYLEARLYNTEFWRKTPESGRLARVMRAVDPATWRQEVFNKEQVIAQEMGSLGLPTQPHQLTWMATRALNEGWTDDYLRRQYMVAFAPKDPMKAGGVLGDTYMQVRARATEWGVPTAGNEAYLLAQNVVGFGGDPAIIDDHYRKKALKHYAGNAAVLDAVANQGMTVREFATPYIDIAARELELNPGQINISDPKWAKAFHSPTIEQGAPQGKPQGFVPMDQDQWLKTIRSEAQYGWDDSQGARELAGEFVDRALTTFGMK